SSARWHSPARGPSDIYGCTHVCVKHKSPHGGSFMKFSARIFPAFALLVLLAGTLYGATPTSGTFNTPTDNTLGTKQTITYYGGPLAISSGFTNYSFPACDQSAAGTDIAPPGVCEIFVLNINLPANYYDTHAGNVTAHLTWQTPAGNDPSTDDVGL